MRLAERSPSSPSGCAVLSEDTRLASMLLNSYRLFAFFFLCFVSVFFLDEVSGKASDGRKRPTCHVCLTALSNRQQLRNALMRRESLLTRFFFSRFLSVFHRFCFVAFVGLSAPFRIFFPRSFPPSLVAIKIPSPRIVLKEAPRRSQSFSLGCLANDG